MAETQKKIEINITDALSLGIQRWLLRNYGDAEATCAEITDDEMDEVLKLIKYFEKCDLSENPNYNLLYSIKRSLAEAGYQIVEIENNEVIHGN